VKTSPAIHRAVYLAASCVLAASSLPADLRAQSGARESIMPRAVGTEVLVSRTEMRVRFARDTATSWGWAAQPDPYRRTRYSWTVIVEGIDGRIYLSISTAPRDSQPREFATLADVVRAANISASYPEQSGPPVPTDHMSAAVEDDRVVLSVRDTARIARLFGLRPASVFVMWRNPSTEHTEIGQTSVWYVEPELPPLDSARHAEAVRSRRHWEASVMTQRRRITDAAGSWALWVEAGDSVHLGIGEWQCRFDLCGSFVAPNDAPRTWGTWTLSDSSVARIHRTTNPQPYWAFFEDSTRVMVLVGRRPGRTTVTARGVHTIADTMPSREPLDSILTREVTVIPPLARLEITPRFSTMRVGERRELRVRVLDRSGRPITGAPVKLGGEGPGMLNISGSNPYTVSFDTPGRHGVTASLGSRADTLWVQVIGTADRR
jgi:hypothetical protein